MNVNKTIGWHGQTQFVRVELAKCCFLTFIVIGRDIEHEYVSSFLFIGEHSRFFVPSAIF